MTPMCGKIVRSLVLALTLGVAGVPAAMAQFTQLPPEIVEGLTLTPEQVNQIKVYTDPLLKSLDDKEDASKRREARVALVAPLNQGKASVSFRIAYSDAVMARVAELANSPEDVIAVNALCVAGDLASRHAVELLVSKLADSRPQVRYQAAFGLRRTMEAIARAPVALDASNLSPTIRAIADRLKAESDGLVAASLIEAGLAAMRVDDVRDLALGTITAAAADKLGSLDPATMGSPWLIAIDSGCRGTRDILNTPGKPMPASALKSCADFAGRSIALTLKGVKARAIETGGAADRASYAEIASYAQQLIQLAGGALSTNFAMPRLGDHPIGELLRSGKVQDEAEFAVGAAQLIGTSGVLTKPPFDLAADRFAVK